MSYFFFNPKIGASNSVACAASGTSDSFAHSGVVFVARKLAATGESASFASAHINNSRPLVGAGFSSSSGLGTVVFTKFIFAAGTSGSFGDGVLLAMRGIRSAGFSQSHGFSPAIDRAVAFSAAGESASFSSRAIFGRTTLIVGCGESASHVGTSKLTVSNGTLKISPRVATIVQAGAFSSSANILRRAV